VGVDEPILPAPDELVALAAAQRPTWQRGILEQAVTAMMLDPRWTWLEILDEVLGMARNPRRSVWDLRRVASPLASRPSADYAARASEARAGLGLPPRDGDEDVPEAGAA